VRTPSSPGHTRLPDRGLADPRGALQHQAMRPRRHRIKKRSHRGHLTVAPHHAHRRHGCLLRPVDQMIRTRPAGLPGAAGVANYAAQRPAGASSTLSA
jgi:hypothetical protein